eukprot:12794900-Prorocentrum_lima.AAC.1
MHGAIVQESPGWWGHSTAGFAEYRWHPTNPMSPPTHPHSAGGQPVRAPHCGQLLCICELRVGPLPRS